MSSYKYHEPLTKIDENGSSYEEGDFVEPEKQKQLRELILSQDLPVREKLDDLRSKIVEIAGTEDRTLLLQGETGSGKSVFSPVAVLDALKQLGEKEKVVMMQPRRDAASGIARAVSAVTGTELGKDVGYSTSEAKVLNPDTALRVVTPGIFMRYLTTGALTKDKVGAVMIDELHEGSVDNHLALGLLKMMQERGEAPLLFLTSATIDKERFQKYFDIGDDNYMRIEGRSYPVEKHFANAHELVDLNHSGDEEKYLQVVADKIEQVCKDGSEGDVLVFLPGAKEIEDVIRRVSEDMKDEGLDIGIEMLPLHGALQPSDRERVIFGNKDPETRRIILSTNIAETSLTVPGIKIVIDSLRQKAVRYNPDTGIDEVEVELISKDQAEQRAGRAGRLSEGTCYRTITKEQFGELRHHPESEISKRNFSDTMLKMIQMGVSPETFPFIEHPGEERIEEGIKELKVLGALDRRGALTKVGEEMIKMPFEPRLSRMMVEARKHGCEEAALVLLAFSREHKVLLPPSEHDINRALGHNRDEKKRNARTEIDAIHSAFEKGDSDLLTNLEIFSQAISNGVFEASRRDNSPESRFAWKKFQSWCDRNYLNPKALTHIAFRLGDYADYAGIDRSIDSLTYSLKNVDPKKIGAVILSGYPDQIIYTHVSGAGNMGIPTYYKHNDSMVGEINLSPGSMAFANRPPLCVASNIRQGKGTSRGMEIKRNYASGVHPIGVEEIKIVRPDLLYSGASHLTFNYHEQAVKKFTSYSLIGADRDMLLDTEETNVKTEEATDKFIDMIMDGHVSTPALDHNKLEMEKIREIYARSQGTFIMPQIKAWYKQRINGISSRDELLKIDDELRFNHEDFFESEEIQKLSREFPASVKIKDQVYRIDYESNPEYFYGQKVDRFSPIINMGIDELMDLQPIDIPKIGPDNAPIKLKIRVYIDGYPRVSDDVNILKYNLPWRNDVLKTSMANAFNPEELRPISDLREIPVLKPVKKVEQVEKKVESPEEVQGRLLDDIEHASFILAEESDVDTAFIPDSTAERIKKDFVKIKTLKKELDKLMGEVRGEVNDGDKLRSLVGDVVSRSEKVVRDIEIHLRKDGKWSDRYKNYKRRIIDLAISEDPNARVDFSLIRKSLIELAREDNPSTDVSDRLIDLMLIGVI